MVACTSVSRTGRCSIFDDQLACKSARSRIRCSRSDECLRYICCSAAVMLPRLTLGVPPRVRRLPVPVNDIYGFLGTSDAEESDYGGRRRTWVDRLRSSADECSTSASRVDRDDRSQRARTSITSTIWRRTDSEQRKGWTKNGKREVRKLGTYTHAMDFVMVMCNAKQAMNCKMCAMQERIKIKRYWSSYLLPLIISLLQQQ